MNDSHLGYQESGFRKNGFASDTMSLLDARRNLYKPSDIQAQIERRNSSRWHQLLPALVRAVDIEGTPFQSETMIENFSSSGLFLHVDQLLVINTPIFVIFRLAPDQGHGIVAPRIAVRGIIQRVSPVSPLQQRPYQAVAVKISRFRFLAEPSETARLQ